MYQSGVDSDALRSKAGGRTPAEGTGETMRPLAEMPERDAARVRLVLTDIDDTLTCDGRLPADAYRALEDLSVAGFMVAPITGRPAGWCDMIARFWPV